VVVVIAVVAVMAAVEVAVGVVAVVAVVEVVVGVVAVVAIVGFLLVGDSSWLLYNGHCAN
jgi:hypothetical protein